MSCFVLYNSIEVQHFELHDKFRTLLVCAGNNENELLKLILLSQNMRMIYKCSPDWDDLCECINDVLTFVILLTDNMRLTLKCSPDWDDSHECDNMRLTLKCSPDWDDPHECDNMRLTLKCSPDWDDPHECDNTRLILKCSPHRNDPCECENDALNFAISLADDMRSLLECSSDWDDFCECEKNVLKFVNLTADNMRSTLKCSPEWDAICEYETDALEFVILLSNNVCTPFIRNPDWREFRDDMHYIIHISIFIISMSLDLRTYFSDWEGFFWVLYYEHGVWIFVANHFQKWDKTSYANSNECKYLEPFSLWNNKSMIIFCGKDQSNSWTFKNETLLCSHQLTFLLLYFIILTILKFNRSIYLFHCNLIKRCEDLVYWLDQCLGYVFFPLYNCAFWSRTFIQRKIIQIEHSNEEAFISSNLTEMNGGLKCYFRAGGRHQTAVNGETVCEYLQTCTDAKLLSDNQFFKGKLFEFIRYQPLSATLNNMSETTDPIFSSKIPLDQLSTFLNVKELRDVSILHNISIPYNIRKETMITYFRNHYCIQCEFYVSVLVEKKKKRVESKKGRKEDKKKLDVEDIDLSYKFPLILLRICY